MGKFDPQKHVMDMRGKDYLEVKWRIVWFREEYPQGTIATEIVSYDPQVIKATVSDNGTVLGTGHGTPKTQGVAKSRPFEGAETAAVGRALAHAGFGTQFTGEEEEEHLADAPVEKMSDAQFNKAAQSTVEAAKELGGVEKPVSVYEAVVAAGLAENEHSAKNALKMCKTGYDTIEKASGWMRIYRAWRDLGADSKQAAKKANDNDIPT